MSNARKTTVSAAERRRRAGESEVNGHAQVFDLDRLSREDAGVAAPKELLPARLNGIDFTMQDPGELDYTQVRTLRVSPEGEQELLQRIMGADVYEQVMASGPIPNWKIWALFNKWQAYYDVPQPGEGIASPIS